MTRRRVQTALLRQQVMEQKLSDEKYEGYKAAHSFSDEAGFLNRAHE